MKNKGKIFFLNKNKQWQDFIQIKAKIDMAITHVNQPQMIFYYFWDTEGVILLFKVPCGII